ncbi:hypothetical protein KXD93_04630 [Mucilaginibacter sp. BJC16-A38]|uniref:hypothetical protein n=1 Tax=Mucilaginibacter phenanthrenivorans TaxID=1234842 RepID=UPI002156FA38|nr:hypothetical protein [Mucilaginibacter phenanthrenivorans]MCR8556911.1 hypothetical protein [Mucilaginibacter phenanthrenivorans]
MHNVILDGISSIIEANRDLLRIPIRQKAKFEGWLKFELAFYLSEQGFKEVDVETTVDGFGRRDITFFDSDSNFYSVELKTSNTNWLIPGIRKVGKPLTKNLRSIVEDCIKINSSQGIVAFVLFPIPLGDKRWEDYIEKIAYDTGSALNKVTNCKLITMDIDDEHQCELLVCTFISQTMKHRKLF